MTRKKSQKAIEQDLAQSTYLLGQDDVVVWSLRNISLPRARPWDFRDRNWQIKILESQSRTLVVKKSAQVGFTTTFLCKILHYLNYHSATAMYTLPRRDDISDFVGATLNPIIQKSPHLHAIISDTDSVRLKKFKATIIGPDGQPHPIESYFHLMEGSVEPRMIPVDVLANDEVDRSDPDYLDQFRARLDASPDPHYYQFSTPTIPGYGIDRIYEGTTQNEWMVRCSRCNAEQVLNWESNFVDKPVPQYVCSHCREKLDDEDIVKGKWVALYPDKEIEGYHITHMMMPISRPVMGMYKELSENKITLKNFYNLRLGAAYSSAVGSFQREMIKQRCFDVKYQKEYVPLSGGSYYIGVDQGNDIHIVVVRKDGAKNKIVFMEKLTLKSEGKWYDRVVALARIFHALFVVVDALPNTHDAREIWNALRNDGDRVAMCHYSDGDLIRRDKDEGKVHVAKVEMFDKLLREFSDGAWKFWDERDPLVEMAIVHFLNMKRDEREDTKGIVKGVWLNTGPDHFAHATVYAMIASMIAPSSRFTVSFLGEEPTETQLEDEEIRQSDSYRKIWGKKSDEDIIFENDDEEIEEVVERLKDD